MKHAGHKTLLKAPRLIVQESLQGVVVETSIEILLRLLVRRVHWKPAAKSDLARPMRPGKVIELVLL